MRSAFVTQEPLLVEVKLWGLNSPTIEDSEMDVSIKLSGKPILLFDPTYLNELIRFFRNTADSSAESQRDILQTLMEEEARKRSNRPKAAPKAEERQPERLGCSSLDDGASDDSEAAGGKADTC